MKISEHHPAADAAMHWLIDNSHHLPRMQEVFASMSISGNRLAEVCHETLRRVIAKEPVSDKYLLGLIFTMKDII